mmetsp:Transcript_38725/g.66982  ORF Transcript_38725/g.66982 Transcript_38725/m.66982 type:complete len:254 (+) Transcript_38725:839-1600(+)
MRFEIIFWAGIMQLRSRWFTISNVRSRRSGKRVNSRVSDCATIFCISSCTLSRQSKPGCSNRAICLRTSRSKEISGTNKEGRVPLAFAIAVRMSSSVRPSKGSWALSRLPNTSLKMYEIRAPPYNSVISLLSSLEPLPSTLLLKFEANWATMRNKAAPLAAVPWSSRLSPREAMLLVTLCRSLLMRALISGRQSLMWCMSIWFSVRARLEVPHLANRLRYLGCAAKNLCSLAIPLRIGRFSWMSFWERFTTAM